MTRINLVPPQELMDQHLFAEYREIKMIPKSLARSLRAAHARQYKGLPAVPPAVPWSTAVKMAVWSRIPKQYTLNTGHVSFFYDKGTYLYWRYADLRRELEDRGVKFDRTSKFDHDEVFKSLDHNFNNDYIPTAEALAIIRTRIAEKIAMKPSWYRYKGVRCAEDY